MPKKLLMILCMALLMNGSALASDYSTSTHFYIVEYLKPFSAGGVPIVQMTFNRRLNPPSAERILREELERAISLFPPDGDVLAFGYTQIGLSPTSDSVVLPDGSGCLIYWAEARKILTDKQYDLAKQKPPKPGQTLNIEISLRYEKGADGRVRILGETNLPDGMELMITVREINYVYSGQDKVVVRDGRIASSWFSDGGRPLRPGAYEISVSSPFPKFEPPSVRAVIGESGENLQGPVHTDMGYKMVDYRVEMNFE